MIPLLTEALVVGIILLLVSLPIMGLVHNYFSDYGRTKYYFATILIGIITHFLFEYSGANTWYCNKGYACMKEASRKLKTEEIETELGF